MSDQIYNEREKEKACEKAIALVEGMSNGDAANHWRAIEEEKLRRRIAELEDTCLSLETELASQVAANQILADMDAKTYAENQRLRAGLSEALDWNWLDDDAPDDSHLRALLGGGENG